MSADLEKGSPSEDPINSEWNLWLERSDTGRLKEIEPTDRRAGARQTAPRAQAAHLQALAARIGVDAEQLAARIPEDTLRRLKFPMFEHVEPDGTHRFKHDVGIIRDGLRALTATDHSSEPIERNATPPRNEHGKFSK